jgi:DNA-binding NarL/FixJ family response regulator
MGKIRVLLGFECADRILAFRTMLMGEPDIEIVGEAINNVDILLKVGSTHADIVAIDLPPYGRDSGLCSHLLAEYPEVKIFAVSEEGDRIVIYETALLRRETSNSLENLADLIHQSMNCVDKNWVKLPE